MWLLFRNKKGGALDKQGCIPSTKTGRRNGWRTFWDCGGRWGKSIVNQSSKKRPWSVDSRGVLSEIVTSTPGSWKNEGGWTKKGK